MLRTRDKRISLEVLQVRLRLLLSPSAQKMIGQICAARYTASVDDKPLVARQWRLCGCDLQSTYLWRMLSEAG